MDNETCIRQAIAAYEALDIEKVLGFCADDIRYTIQSTQEFGPYCADCSGKEEFVEILSQFSNDWEIKQFQLVDLIVSGDRAASRQNVSFIRRASGAPLITQNALFWTIRDGLISELHEFHDTATIGGIRG